MSRKTTIYDIARYLKISPASVSYVINGVNKVSKETKEKVLAAIKELGYQKDTNAVYLSTGKSNTIALFVPSEDLSTAFAQNPFYGEFFGSFAKRIQRKGFDLLIEPALEAKNFAKWIKGKSLRGIATIGKFPHEYYEVIKQLEIPAVLVDVFEEYASEFTTLSINDSDGSYLATEHLLEQGHREIAFLSGEIEHSEVDKRRYLGYAAALKDHGIPLKEEYLFQSEATFDAGLAVSKKIMDNPNITGLVCAADILAMGVIRGYYENKKHIPEDLSIVGFDDIQIAKLVSPPLTTIKQDINEKGRLAAKLLIDAMLGEDKEAKHLVIQPTLVVRESTMAKK
ncbi:MAG: LacI family DNA-binding transcriptional regulator [Bacilli bacterium]|nr:LacI family DNA-binding transcriptional regulator [Bacilli bacterium]